MMCAKKVVFWKAHMHKDPVKRSTVYKLMNENILSHVPPTHLYIHLLFLIFSHFPVVFFVLCLLSSFLSAVWLIEKKTATRSVNDVTFKLHQLKSHHNIQLCRIGRNSTKNVGPEKSVQQINHTRCIQIYIINGEKIHWIFGVIL